MRSHLSRADMAELKRFVEALPQIQVVLARHAADDPDAKRLHQTLTALGAGSSSPASIYLAAGEGSGTAPERDVGGHVVARYEGAPENCARCTVALADAGDFSADSPPGTFASSVRHIAAQKLILKTPGLTYLRALQQVEEENS